MFNSAYSALRNVRNIGAKNRQTRRNKKRATTRLRANDCLIETADYFCSLASQSRDVGLPFISISILPLMAPSANLPEYFIVIELPPMSRTTLNETSAPVTLPSVMSVGVGAAPPR